jgi:hypothetical protein
MKLYCNYVLLDPMEMAQQPASCGLKSGGCSSQPVRWVPEQMRRPLQFLTQIEPPSVLATALRWLLLGGPILGPLQEV